ncbi:MAG TPA: HAMP domain-containing sensor histidine kinase [Bacillota bacterium]|mgnify:CR=1 FL=1|nr:HAMP domain-containing sensor histidine kinase [Bacillota bacterium]HOL09008.1 HAMP domain-containing sensor histidine kinase [Bacillota bacterium]HPO96683.1 HAMP domain-containing sensor histidine kinase [Bacillota bacterium]
MIVITNGILTFFVSRSIIKPLNKLKTAAISIKNGDLDTKIDIKSKDELGNLAQTFEEMRQQLKKSIESQIQYDNNRKELISAISHDLKTPVTSIKGYVEGIMDGVAGSPEKLDKYLKTIHNNANRLDQLIDELFLFSKLDLRKLPFNFETIDIDKFLTDILDELRLIFTEPKLKMVYNNQLSSPAMIVADRDKLYRVIFNIINNASKYADPNKENSEVIITLSESAKQNSVTIEIRDNGRGIKTEELPYIFDRFYRAEKDRNSSTGGSGLGLAIAKLIIEEHGGQIWAESVYLEGTSISFSLPKH